MAEVYEVSTEVPAPALTINMDEYNASIKKYVEDMKAYIKGLGYAEPETGKVIRFHVADGHAEYMVISVKNPMLVHMEVGDAWSFQYAHLLTAKEILQSIKQEEALASIFAKH